MKKCSDFITHTRKNDNYYQIVLDVWDGPTRAVLRCFLCDAEALIDVIDWEEGEETDDIRVACISPLPKGSIKQIENILPKNNLIVKPTWSPIWKFDTVEAEVEARKRIAEVLEQSGSPAKLIAWKGGWKQEIFVCKDLEESYVDSARVALSLPRKKASPIDWFEYLGIHR